MTTPLKALIQERLRTKIVRQEVDGDDADDVNDLLTMDAHHQHHQHQSREHQHQRQRHHHSHHHHHHHHHRDIELSSHARGPVRGAGIAQRALRQSQPQQQIQEGLGHGNQYQMEDTSSMSQHQKRHKGPHHHRHQNQPQQQQHSEHYSTNQKLIDYYTYEHHQKFDGHFRQDRSFGRGFHGERYKTLGYPSKEEKEEDSQRSPLASPWGGQSAPSNNQFHDQDPEEEDEEEEEGKREDDQQEQQPSKPIVGGVESSRYAAPLPPPSSSQQQQQQQHRSASAELRHVRDRDSRVHPADLHSFRNARESQQEPELPMSLGYDSNNNVRERHVYARGHFESQLCEDDVHHDSKQQEEEPTESYHGERHDHHHHHKHGHHHHKEQRHQRNNTRASFEDPESPHHVLPRKRGFGTFEDPYEVANDGTVTPKPHERRLARLRHYEDTVSDSIDNTDSSLTRNTEEYESEFSYNSSHRGHQHQRQHHQFNHDRFGNSAFYTDNLVTSPLAAASSLAPLVFAAATSPRLETKRASGSSLGRQQQSQVETGIASSYSAAAPSLGALPAPLDMVMVETTRRHRDNSNLDAMPHVSGHNGTTKSSLINRRSSSTLLRRLDAMLSLGCHRAATAFVEKRRRRAANSTPRTMATQRWLQSMDPQFRERAAADASATSHQEDDLQFNHHKQSPYQELPLALPPLLFAAAARSASSCSNRSSSSSTASSCASPV